MTLNCFEGKMHYSSHYILTLTLEKDDDRALFVDFIQKLLTIDPGKRPTADEALEHPWILSGFNLTEEELKYPPEE